MTLVEWIVDGCLVGLILNFVLPIVVLEKHIYRFIIEYHLKIHQRLHYYVICAHFSSQESYVNKVSLYRGAIGNIYRYCKNMGSLRQDPDCKERISNAQKPCPMTHLMNIVARLSLAWNVWLVKVKTKWIYTAPVNIMWNARRYV